MIKVAVGILFHPSSPGSAPEVLLCQRRAGSKYALKWEFPGGKVEPGEEVEDCLVRELREELGITADEVTLFHRQQAVYPDSGHYEVWYFLVENSSGTPVNRVFNRIEWVPVDDLPEYDILEGNLDVVGILPGVIRQRSDGVRR